mmetsp:Transcript_46198/g.115869  ORF Transcript_46198/g.115869 Transcript_46198/m.115869 type:complete len:437 (-) Transcript_46198:526-1836(-)
MLWFFPMSSLSLLMSVCMSAIDACSSVTSACCTRTCPSTRTLFCVSTAACDFISPTLSDCTDASFDSLTSSVCVDIHMRCRSLHTFLFWSTSFLRLLIVASRGPTTAASAPAACSNLARRPSKRRLSVSRSRIFFSISSFLLLISTSYFAISCSLRLSSESMSCTVLRSWSLCAIVLSESTLILASSFRTCAISFSLMCIPSCMLCVCRSVLCAAFCKVVCSASDVRICCSCRCVSFIVDASSFSTLLVSSSTCFFSCPTLTSSASDCSSDDLRIWYCSLSRTLSPRSVSICFSRKATEFLTLVRIDSTASLRSCSFLMLCLNDEISPVIVCSSCCRSRSAFCSDCRCSSLRSTARSELFHCAMSCFFSKRMRSISLPASCSTSMAPLVSLCCASICSVRSSIWSSSCLVPLIRSSINRSCIFFSFSSTCTCSSAL